MAFTKPIFAVGLDIPNCNFQLPGDSGGLAAGWTVDTGSASAYAYFGQGVIGRPRTQYLYTSGPTTTNRLISAPSAPYHGTVATSTKFIGVLHCYGSGTGNKIRLKMRFYNASGTAVGSDVQLLELTTPTADGVYTGEVTTTPPATAAYIRIMVEAYHSAAGGMYTYFAFAGVGVWDGSSSSYFQASRFPVFPGTTYQRAGADGGRYRSEAGRVRVVDRTRHSRANTVTLAFTNMPQTEMVKFEKLDHLNNGQNWESSAFAGAVNPQGGSWPILLLPGHTGLPTALLCDMSGGFDPDEEWGRVDPAYWNGSLQFTERG